jgi:elongation factor 1 alpha-like protein
MAPSTKKAPQPKCKFKPFISLLYLHLQVWLVTIPLRTSLPNFSDQQQAPHSSNMCSEPFSAADFFKDCPWLKVPEHRRSEILIEPLYSRRGLLGGASSGKVSKLAALAAKRRQKESEQQSASSVDVDAKSKDDYVASLAKLKVSQAPKTKLDPGSDIHSAPPDSTSATQAEQTLSEKTKEFSTDDKQSKPGEDLLLAQDLRAAPSAFGSIMTNHDTAVGQALETLFLTAPAAVPASFAGPSPDDIVTKAQTGKGRP